MSGNIKRSNFTTEVEMDPAKLIEQMESQAKST
jgi:hypothetical protein